MTVLLLLMITPPFQAYLDSLPTGVKVGVLVESASGDVMFAHRPDAIVPSASVIKIPILAAMIEQADAGHLDWDATTRIEVREQVGGAGILQEHPTDTLLTWAELARLMISISDNTATNEVIRHLGMDLINARLDAWGLSSTRLRRHMMDFEAAREGRENVTTARDINTLLKRFAGHPEFVRYLLTCQDSATLPAGFPAGTRFAHKTGVLAYVRGDSGILLDHGPMFVSAFVEGAETQPQAEAILAGIGRLMLDE